MEPIGYEEVNCREVVDEEAWDEVIVVEDGYWDCPELCKYNEELTADDPKCTPPQTPCVWQQYWLRDEEGHMCYIIRNFDRGDSAGKLPVEYKNTQLMRTICSYDCQGNYVQDFGQLDIFGTTCQVCDEGCGQ